MEEKALKDIENRDLYENDMVFYSTHTGTLRAGEVGIILSPNLILSLLGKTYNLNCCYKIEKYNSSILRQLNELLLDTKVNYIKEKQNFKKYGLIRGGVYRYHWQDVSSVVIYLGECKIKSQREIISDFQEYVGPLFLNIDLQSFYKETKNNYNYYLDKLKYNISDLYKNELDRFLKQKSSIYSELGYLDIEMENNALAIDRFVFSLEDFKLDKLTYNNVLKGKVYVKTTITFL